MRGTAFVSCTPGPSVVSCLDLLLTELIYVCNDKPLVRRLHSLQAE